ncbi:hypothetical protein BDW72DRAFT_166824 [Aspergillus terricola var. indicus]
MLSVDTVLSAIIQKRVSGTSFGFLAAALLVLNYRMHRSAAPIISNLSVTIVYSRTSETMSHT